MSDACLGMSAEDLVERGQLEFWRKDAFAGKTCRVDDWQHAYYVDKGGTKYTLGFRGYPFLGKGQMRFRLAEIALHLPMSEEQLDHLRRTLTDRSPLPPDAGRAGRWTLSTPLADVSLDASYAPAATKQALILSMSHRRLGAWVNKSPECGAALPKL